MRMSSTRYRTGGRLAALATAALAFSGCTQAQLDGGTSSSYLILTAIEAASGATPSEFAGILQSDVVTNVKTTIGEEQVLVWRRSFDIAPPGGESLKDTAARVLPYYKAHIWPDVKAGRNVLVAAHGNSLRALIMYLEELTAQQILEREVATGAPIIYHLTEHGQVAERRDLVT